MIERCSICRDICPPFGSLHVGGVSDGEEMVLCPECAAMVFPGMRETMVANCPICAMSGRHN